MSQSGLQFFANIVLPISSHLPLGTIDEPGVDAVGVTPLKAVPMFDFNLEFGTLAKLFHDESLHDIFVGLFFEICDRKIPVLKALREVISSQRPRDEFLQTEETNLSLTHSDVLIDHPVRLSAAHKTAALSRVFVGQPRDFTTQGSRGDLSEGG